jgi:phosphomethylpyrimidine synthase
MKTQIEWARQGVATEQMQTVATDEQMDAELVRDRVANGQIVIPNNPFRQG